MAAQTTTRTPAATNTEASLEEDAVLTVHTVKAGESLGDVAVRYNVSKDQLRRWNLLTTDDVSPGVELYVFVRK
jgi:LysM repeat protein